MSKTVNILGETAKEQWLNAINIYELCIVENARNVEGFLHDECNSEYECAECNRINWDGECPYIHSIEVVIEQGKAFAGEMRRLVNGMMD